MKTDQGMLTWGCYVNIYIEGQILQFKKWEPGGAESCVLEPITNHIHIKPTLYELDLRQGENHDNNMNCRKKRKFLTLRSLVKACLCLCHCWQPHLMARHTGYTEETWCLSEIWAPPLSRVSPVTLLKLPWVHDGLESAVVWSLSACPGSQTIPFLRGIPLHGYAHIIGLIFTCQTHLSVYFFQDSDYPSLVALLINTTVAGEM